MTGTTLALRRVLPMLVWCVLVVIGLAFVGGKDDRSGPVAARQLPLNTLLLKSDLVPDAYAGRYVVKQPDGVAAGVPLRPQDVASQPVMPSGLEVGTYYSVPVAAAEIAYGANARATVHLCGKGGVDLATVKIVVVHCDSATPAPGVDCSALIQVPDAAASKLAAKAIKDQTTAKELAQVAQLEGDSSFLSTGIEADQRVDWREATKTACSANHPHFLPGTDGL